MPAVSPPATLFIFSRPISRKILIVKKSINVDLILGKDISFLQSTYVGLGNPDANLYGVFELKPIAPTSISIRADSLAISLSGR